MTRTTVGETRSKEKGGVRRLRDAKTNWWTCNTLAHNYDWSEKTLAGTGPIEVPFAGSFTVLFLILFHWQLFRRGYFFVIIYLVQGCKYSGVF